MKTTSDLSAQKTDVFEMLSPESRKVLEEMGYQKLTPIQEKAIPFLLGPRDFIGQSQTGSGKTAAFSLPLIEKVDANQNDIQALVLCPTRELCAQVAREIRRLGRFKSKLHVAVLCGGVPVPPQIQALASGPQILVGTPGRVLDHLSRGRLDFFNLKMLILDEADRMLDMGFAEDMDEIIESTPRTRQTVFFSATFGEDLKGMSKAYQIDPLMVKIDSSNESRPAIHQYFIPALEDKTKSLIDFFRQSQASRALIFCNLKQTVEELSLALQKAGFASAGLSSDYEQVEREARLAMFKNGSLPFLVATDVAARGIDVTDLPMVINFDFPEDNESYLHRIGRTGRAGKEGFALSFIKLRDRLRFEEIESFTKAKIVEWKGPESKTPFPHEEQKLWKTFLVFAGRKDKLRPGDLQGWLTGEKIGLDQQDVGKFEIFDNYAFFALTKNQASLKKSVILKGQMKGRELKIVEIDETTNLKSFFPPRKLSHEFKRNHKRI